MIYLDKYLDMTTELDPNEICKYLEFSNWKNIDYKRTQVKVYQFFKGEIFNQVYIPLNKEFSDYRRIMYEAIQTIADVENKSLEQVFLYLLNPNTDVIKIHFYKSNIESGNILLDDAVNLFENTQKLLKYTVIDIINPKKTHFGGRIDDSVQNFMNQCRFGQTEIGSYVVSVVCPFAELSDTGIYKQLSIFSDEERCANSLTRRVTNKLLDNVAFVKQKIDEGNIEALVSDNSDISSNFLEALNGLNLHSEDTSVEFVSDWSPVVKDNRSENNHITVSNHYYQSIENVIKTIKESKPEKKIITGRVKQLSASPKVKNRKNGKIVVVFESENSTEKSVTVQLSNDNYLKAVEAHQLGKLVKLEGDLSGKEKLTMSNVAFSIIE